jgi:hypothetical protein
VFAKFEVDVPLKKSYEDSTLVGVPALMEKDPYSLGVKKEEEVPSTSALLPEYEDPDEKKKRRPWVL